MFIKYYVVIINGECKMFCRLSTASSKQVPKKIFLCIKIHSYLIKNSKDEFDCLKLKIHSKISIPFSFLVTAKKIMHNLIWIKILINKPFITVFVIRSTMWHVTTWSIKCKDCCYSRKNKFIIHQYFTVRYRERIIM